MKILFRLSVCLLTIFLASCGKDAPADFSASGSTDTGSLQSQKEPTEIDQVELARRRVALRSIIRKGDYYQAKNDAQKSIEFYKSANEQIGNDPKIALRLANAYFELKDFRKAADVFTTLDLSELDEPTKLKVIASVMLDQDRTDRKEAIQKLSLAPGTKEYLSLISDCTDSPENCVSLVESNQSSDYRVLSLKEAVRNASSTSDDAVFIKALLTGKLFEQKAFFAAKRLGLSILEKRPDYWVVLKVTGYCSYELGNYKESASLLERYYTHENTDVEVAYMLGIVNYFKEDYETSNLYFNNAVLNGYAPKTELERRLVYNYVLLGDTKWAFKIFRYLLDESDVTAEDYQIALFMADQAGEYSKSHIWSQKGLARFPQDSRLLAFAGASSLRSGDAVDAEQYLQQALQQDGINPIATLELGRLFIEKKEYDIARRYLREAIDTDTGGYFGKEADSLLRTLPTSNPDENTGSLDSASQTSSIPDTTSSEPNVP